MQNVLHVGCRHAFNPTMSMLRCSDSLVELVPVVHSGLSSLAPSGTAHIDFVCCEYRTPSSLGPSIVLLSHPRQLGLVVCCASLQRSCSLGRAAHCTAHRVP